MNVDTGELRRLSKLNLEKVGFEPVPQKYNGEVKERLGNNDSAMVDMNDGTPLSSWANKKRIRRKNNLKNKNKIAKNSRKRNRK